MDKARLGLIGLGLIGMSHGKTLAKVDECQFVAVSDTDEGRRDVVVGLGVPFYRDYTEMIAKETIG